MLGLLTASLAVPVPLAQEVYQRHIYNKEGGSWHTIKYNLTHAQWHAAQFGISFRDPVSGLLSRDKPQKFHSQSGQEQTVLALFGNKTDGYFVDLAANDPISYSNTRALERDFSWRGVCIDGNQEKLDKLVIGRTCRVFKAAVTGEAGKEVEFTTPAFAGTWEDGMGGIVSATTDNKVVKPGYSKRKWVTTKLTTVTLKEILDRANAPSTIDYLSLDIEGAECDAMRGFFKENIYPFAAYRFLVMTVERPSRDLRSLLRKNGYVYVKDHGCYGDQMWVHSTMAEQAARVLELPPLKPHHDHNVCDLTLCGSPPGTKSPTIDGGCCGYVPTPAAPQCVEK